MGCEYAPFRRDLQTDALGKQARVANRPGRANMDVCPYGIYLFPRRLP
jgi:hypothetical protein